jgi:5-methylcytosine-specific restriction endonuclease McrA
MADASIALKICSSCGAAKTTDDFHRNKATKDGRYGKCKACVKTYQQANKDRIAAYQREWAKNNPDKNRAKSDRWRANNPERAKAKDRIYREIHRDERLAALKRWRERNKEHVGAYSKAYEETRKIVRAAQRRADYASNPRPHREARKRWRIANPDKVRIQKHVRRARKRSVGGKYAPADLQRLFVLQKGRCPVCRGALKNYHVDHITALSRGGSNDPINLQLLHPVCNMRKTNKDPIEFMQEQGFLL